MKQGGLGKSMLELCVASKKQKGISICHNASWQVKIFDSSFINFSFEVPQMGEGGGGPNRYSVENFLVQQKFFELYAVQFWYRKSAAWCSFSRIPTWKQLDQPSAHVSCLLSDPWRQRLLVLDHPRGCNRFDLVIPD